MSNLENVKVTLDLKDFDDLRKESDYYREIARKLSNYCEVNYKDFNKSKKDEDIKIIVDNNKLLKLAREYSCWGRNDEIDTDTAKLVVETNNSLKVLDFQEESHTAMCPTCKILVDMDRDKYCYKCGQKLEL